MVTENDSQQSSFLPPDLQKAATKKAINRWNMEALTGLVGWKAIHQHQQRQARNLDSEDAAARRVLWGDSSKVTEDMGDHIILGDSTIHPAPIVMQQGSGLGKILIGAALAAGLMGIPAAGLIGYGLSQVMGAKPSNTTTNTTTGDNLDIGLGRIEDLLPASPGP